MQIIKNVKKMHDAMTSTQVERKFLWQQEKYSLAKEKELGELDQNVTPLLLFIATLLLNMFCCIFQHSFIKTPYLFRAEVELLYERSVKLGFIFNNYSSFLNSSMHLILCGDGFIYAKLKKIMVSFHAVADKLPVELLPRELWQQ